MRGTGSWDDEINAYLYGSSESTKDMSIRLLWTDDDEYLRKRLVRYREVIRECQSLDTHLNLISDLAGNLGMISINSSSRRFHAGFTTVLLLFLSLAAARRNEKLIVLLYVNSKSLCLFLYTLVSNLCRNSFLLFFITRCIFPFFIFYNYFIYIKYKITHKIINIKHKSKTKR